jgi:hypothetical protein
MVRDCVSVRSTRTGYLYVVVRPVENGLVGLALLYSRWVWRALVSEEFNTEASW